MTKMDCAWFRKKRCEILKRRYCDFEKCNWYKPINNNDLLIDSNNSSANSNNLHTNDKSKNK